VYDADAVDVTKGEKTGSAVSPFSPGAKVSFSYYFLFAKSTPASRIM
jgi:hypothetical protein